MEYTEHQHILDAKEPYRASNRHEATPQMLRHVQRRTAAEMKYEYLGSIGLIPEKPVCPARPRSLGSQVRDHAIDVSTVSCDYKLKCLEIDLCTFLHNQRFPPGEGWRHRVKRRKLPKLTSPQVYFA